MGLCATWLTKQMRVLRAMARRLRVWDLVVWAIRCPTELQPADPLSRLECEFHGVVACVEQVAWFKWHQLTQFPEACTCFGTFMLA